MPYYEIVTKHSFDKTLGDLTAYEKTQEYIENLQARYESGRGLIYVGLPGTGKTLLAHCVLDAALDAVVVKVRAITMVGYQNLLTRQLDFMALVRATKSQEAEAKWWVIDNTLNALRNTAGLVLVDDVGKEHTTSSGFIEDAFDHLVRTRGNKGLPTIMTTNVQIKDWDTAYGPSMASYIHQICDIIRVDAPDYRQTQQ